MFNDSWPLHIDKGFSCCSKTQRALLQFLKNVSSLKKYYFWWEKTEKSIKMFPIPGKHVWTDSDYAMTDCYLVWWLPLIAISVTENSLVRGYIVPIVFLDSNTLWTTHRKWVNYSLLKKMEEYQTLLLHNLSLKKNH